MFWILISTISLLDLAGVFSAKLWITNKNPLFLWLTVLFFALVGIAFAFSLKYEDLAIANILWIAFSIILVTLMGIFYFKESIGLLQMIGIAVITLGVILVNWPSR